MTLQTVELPEEVIQRAKALTGKRTARAAVTALVERQTGGTCTQTNKPQPRRVRSGTRL